MLARTAEGSTQTIAVALHGIEPATFEPCALIRDWLEDHGVDRVTLLVIPARDLHPIGERSPEMVRWLSERRYAGDSIAQHGFQHTRTRRDASPRQLLARLRGHRLGEFVGLDAEETRRAVHAGWRGLKLAGIEPEASWRLHTPTRPRCERPSRSSFAGGPGCSRFTGRRRSWARVSASDRPTAGDLPLPGVLRPPVRSAGCSRPHSCARARCCRQPRCA